MAYTRQTVVDATPSGDSVKQAVLDLDTDLTGAFTHLNELLTGLGLKLDASLRGSPDGVASLGSDGKIVRDQMPTSELPVGMIAAFGMQTLPADCSWIECDGSSLVCADYQDLFAAIGYAFGGAGLNFNLPDLRGRFLRGWNHTNGHDPDASARTGGDVVGSTQADVIKKHNHPVGDQDSGVSGIGSHPNTQGWNMPASIYNTYTQDFVVTGDTLSPSAFANVPQGTETRPANVAVMYCVKWR